MLTDSESGCQGMPGRLVTQGAGSLDPGLGPRSPPGRQDQQYPTLWAGHVAPGQAPLF